jgi:predicted glycoside hydrolase/deacetylase ChbG (UPF0249 family)
MAPPRLQPVILCADDFALAEGVSEGILRLADAGRLTAIGCMTVSPLWRSLAGWLDAVGSRCDIGLHLTLTDLEPIGALPRLAPAGRLPRLGRLMAAAFAGSLEPAEVREELRRQWDAFVAARGRPPDFLDGHRHVHLLPGIRGAVLELARMGGLDRRPYLRVCWEPPTRVVSRGVAVGKASFLCWLSIPFRREIARLGLAANDSFRGVHAFDPAVDYAVLFPRFLAGRARRPLIMCHPGFGDARLRAVDTVTDQRRREYDYFASERFPADLQAAGCRLARFREIESPADAAGPGPTEP